MKITVRISSIEIIIDRPDFMESKALNHDPVVLRESVLPTLTEAVKQAKELYLAGRDAKPNG